ncbi:MAG: single-stranded DNA-binding protein [Eubacteriales bacterium]|nr:single-stranded DNA-binding protein [Eubacteriales bacterium]
MRIANENNTAVFRGQVKDEPVFNHALFEESFYGFTLLVPRLSGVIDELPVTFPGRLPIHPRAGERVSVFGQLRSYKKQTEQGNRLLVTVFAKEIDFSDEEPENDVHLIGFLCKPVIFRTTPFMREISDLLIAVNRPYGKSVYLPCIAWGRNAHFARDIPVGSSLHIEGRLQSRTYVKSFPNGTSFERVAYEVSCSSIELA